MNSQIDNKAATPPNGVFEHDRLITISVANSRMSKDWRAKQLTVSDLYNKLCSPVVGAETYAEYIKLPKAEQDTLKDVGGFVGGSLRGSRRKAAEVTGRDLITLDFDNIPGWQTEAVTARCEALQCSYCIYSTRKHIPGKPRLRIIIPLDRTATPDEYEPIARRMAQQIGIEMADKTTFDVGRLMYWPSKCADTEYYYKYKDAPLLPVDMVLGTYADWHDVTSWPQVPGAVSHQALAVKQGDPLEKPGTVGAFCRTYTITEAMEVFLPGIYEAVDNSTDRYTYLGGSTTGGAIIYENKFLYSHHATDPCSDRLVNAFDMVRLHKFGDLDEDTAANTPITKLPSFIKMCELAENDKQCRATLNKERQQAAAADFAGVTTEGIDDNYDWCNDLEYNSNSNILKNTINNFLIILNNDPNLKGRFAYNAFAERYEVLGAVEWDTRTERRMWSDADNNGLYWYIERVYGQKSRGSIDSALIMYMTQHRFNEVQDYINSLTWDGTPRLDTLFIDYLGAEDTKYTRTVTRKMLVAAIARAIKPGTKFDNMLILVGPQASGKSTILRKMSRGWFNDNIRSFEGKDAAELLQGIWLVEIAELEAFRKSESTRIKQFLSLNSDIYRAAYARNAEERPRKCVFFGTTNSHEFLNDPTGERRFWPVDIKKQTPKLNVFEDLTDEVVSQIWAEAKHYYESGECLHLGEDMEKQAINMQLAHKVENPKAGLIKEFIERKVPKDWTAYTIDMRKQFWCTYKAATQNDEKEHKLIERDRISAIEIWVECLDGDKENIKTSDSREIKDILNTLDDWEYSNSPQRVGGEYGKQRCFIRKTRQQERQQE